MTVDRDRTLKAAQSYVDAQMFDRALDEYQKIIREDPTDTRVLLKIGDLQVKGADYTGAIATYEKVADFYGRQGFAVKAIAVYKQVRELVQRHAVSRADHYAYVVDRLTSLYSELGLVNEALTTLDEEANWLRSRDREDDAVRVYRRMTQLARENPLPHLRLAEGLCRVGQVDEAMTSFWTAADLLIGVGRPDDALRVAERMLHFTQDARTAKLAAKIYLQKGTQPEGMQALSRLQICFQADPKDLETLELLAEAFEVIGQSSKALEVRKEIVRQAHEQGQSELFKTTLRELQQQAPDDEQVRALTQLPPPKLSSSSNVRGQTSVLPDIPPAPARPNISSVPPHPADLETIDDLEFLDDSAEVDLDMTFVEPLMEERVSTSNAINLVRAVEPSSPSMPGSAATGQLESAVAPRSPAPPPRTGGPSMRGGSTPRPPPGSAPPGSAPPRPYAPASPPASSRPATSRPASQVPSPRPEIDPSLHTKRALTDAHAYRSLGLMDKAIETVQVALEFAPQSIELRECLRDLYVDQGDRDGAIEEMLTMAEIYIEYDRSDHAQTVLLNVLEAVPNHALALRTLEQINRQTHSSVPPPSSVPPTASVPPPVSVPPSIAGPPPVGSMPSMQSTGSMPPNAAMPPASVPPSSASGPLPRFEPKSEEETSGTVEDALEEAEFFVSRGLLEDALLILNDQLDRTPGHPLLLESVREIQEALDAHDRSSAPSDEATVESDLSDFIREPEPTSAASTVGPASGRWREPPPSSTERRTGAERGDFDLKAQLGELERVVRESQRPPAPGKHQSKVDVDKMFEKFKARVRTQVSDHDSATHYDLGVAYKEMKLFADAIEEFKLAARDPSLECNCYSTIGLLYAEQNDWENAAKGYTRALSSVKKTVVQEANLYYDLGHAHEQLSRFDRAAYYFQQVLRRDPAFRDARERLSEVRKKAQAATKSANGSDDELDRAFEELLGGD